MFERILIPLDGSSLAELILVQLKPLIKREHTDVLLLQGVYAAPSISRVDTSKLAAEHGAEAESYLRHVVERLQLDGIAARALVKKDAPEDAILDTARDEKVDLIAMTTHGRAGFERWMMGSVTEKVLRAAESPLLILHSFKRTPEGASVPLAGEPVSFRSILVPIDVGEASLAVIPWIERLAKVYPAEIVLLNVKPEPLGSSPGDSAPPESARPLEFPITVKMAQDRLAAAGLRVRAIQAYGNPPARITEAASSGGYDLLAMATHGRSGLKRWVLGSIAERILRSSPIPMLVVPSKMGG